MDAVTLKQAKNYADKLVQGLGALKGANCVIDSIDTIPEGNRVTFSWTGTDGITETSTMIVENGVNGNDGTSGVGVSKIEKINTVGLKDTYRITFTDNTTYDYSVTNGQKGEQGIQGLRGEKGEQGEQGVQGVQGIQGEKGDDGYPFLIYKEYSDVSEFNKNDFPEIGLMFMIVADDATSFPVYRYTGDDSVPYRYVTDLTGGEGIKGEKGDKGEQGEQGVQGENGKDGITYIPTIGTVTFGDVASATVVTDDETSIAEFSFVLPKEDNITIDTILSDTSENPVQNKVIKQAIDNKADKTVATTSADGLMSAEDKGKLDAFEITTTGGKLHDKDIATTDLIPTTLPADGGNADTVGGKSADDFAAYKPYAPIYEGDLLDISEMGTYSCNVDYTPNLPNGVESWCYVTMTRFRDAGYKRFVCSPFNLIGANNHTLFLASEADKGSDGNLIWKELSTNPAKSVQVVGTTDNIGNFILWNSSENRKPVFITFADHYVIPFLSSNGNYYAHVLSAETDEQLTNTAVTATVFYIEI